MNAFDCVIDYNPPELPSRLVMSLDSIRLTMTLLPNRAELPLHIELSDGAAYLVHTSAKVALAPCRQAEALARLSPPYLHRLHDDSLFTHLDKQGYIRAATLDRLDVVVTLDGRPVPVSIECSQGVLTLLTCSDAMQTLVQLCAHFLAALQQVHRMTEVDVSFPSHPPDDLALEAAAGGGPSDAAASGLSLSSHASDTPSPVKRSQPVRIPQVFTDDDKFWRLDHDRQRDLLMGIDENAFADLSRRATARDSAAADSAHGIHFIDNYLPDQEVVSPFFFFFIHPLAHLTCAQQDEVPRFCAHSAPAKSASRKPLKTTTRSSNLSLYDPRFAGQWYASHSSAPLSATGERPASIVMGSAPPILECHVPMPDPATCSQSTLMETLQPPATLPPATLQLVVSNVSVCWRWFDGRDWPTRELYLLSFMVCLVVLAGIWLRCLAFFCLVDPSMRT